MTGVLERSVTAIANRLDRRSFLRRTTMAATAVAVAPADFILRPNTAYAAICNCSGQGCPCGSLCCDGYTEFCCTLYGENGCPPGTVAAGWWKVDGSSFCGGGPRYYLDCNALCGSCGCSNGVCNGSCSGTTCSCANGDCNNRKSGCTKFRYGQCNQDIACVGPIDCRVVTCTPPWVLDESCTTASRTDELTRNHHRSCLVAPFGALDVVQDAGQRIRATGWAIDQNRGTDPVEIRIMVDGQSMRSQIADRSRPDVAAAYPGRGDRHGFDITIPAGPGYHVVCLWARDTGSGADTFLGFREIVVDGVFGYLDSIRVENGKVRIIGWAGMVNVPNVPATVGLFVDGREWWRGPADARRPDLERAIPGFGELHGIDRLIGVPSGRHQICVSILLGGYPWSTPLGCRTVTVP